MSANDASTASPPANEPRKNNGQFVKGKSGNPKGRGKGNLSQKTKFLQIMTTNAQQRAIKVLNQVLRQAEDGDKESQKLVLTVLQPFIKREAEREGGGGDKRPMVNVIVNQTEGRTALPPAVRVIDAKK